MKYRFILALFLCIFLLGHSFILAQAPEAPVAPAEEKKAITPPNTMEEAKALFIEAWNMEHEQQFDDAIARYNTVIAYFQKLETREGNIYVMHVMNNVGGILASQGKYRESINLFKGALDLAIKLDDYANLSEFHHKLGILYNQVYNAQVESEKMKNVVYPAGQKFELSDKVLFTKGSYTRFSQIDNELIANRIQMRGSQNPFEIENDLYSKLVNLKVRSDFEPDKLLTPDSVKFIIQIEKKGYFNVSKLKDLLPSMEYAEINETM
ncbi:MAG TPA: tetratricopeptide repeat protein, partial [Planctomycetota bacterium]|nr:tetratricopeptide repeat protein [Planctomycetota bacterium]